MATTIAISGNGGSGKTTLAAMIIRSLLRQADRRAVLAVDADPNACLGMTLGVEPAGTIADIREDARAKAPSNAGMDRLRTVEYHIQQAITEADGFDLLTMGRPEGPSCYCAVNNMLRKFLDKLSAQYQFVVIDNEAGMEHLSRRTTSNVDTLCIVTNPTAVGFVTARRIFELAGQLPIAVRQIGVIWNKVDDSSSTEPAGMEEPSPKCHTPKALETFGYIPYDRAVSDTSMRGKTVFDLKENDSAFMEVRKTLEHILALRPPRTVNNRL
jgi:CO dehydrogenase maturation factor